MESFYSLEGLHKDPPPFRLQLELWKLRRENEARAPEINGSVSGEPKVRGGETLDRAKLNSIVDQDERKQIL